MFFFPKEYWWAFVLGILGLIGFMSVFVKICSVHTPSSNPRLKPARTLSLKRGVSCRCIDSWFIENFCLFSLMVLDIMADNNLDSLYLHQQQQPQALN